MDLHTILVGLDWWEQTHTHFVYDKITPNFYGFFGLKRDCKDKRAHEHIFLWVQCFFFLRVFGKKVQKLLFSKNEVEFVQWIIYQIQLLAKCQHTNNIFAKGVYYYSLYFNIVHTTARQLVDTCDSNTQNARTIEQSKSNNIKIWRSRRKTKIFVLELTQNWYQTLKVGIVLTSHLMKLVKHKNSSKGNWQFQSSQTRPYQQNP